MGETDWRGNWVLFWWTWVWASSGSWWRTGRPGMLQPMGSQRVGHDWVTELNWTQVEAKDLWREKLRSQYSLAEIRWHRTQQVFPGRIRVDMGWELSPHLHLINSISWSTKREPNITAECRTCMVNRLSIERLYITFIIIIIVVLIIITKYGFNHQGILNKSSVTFIKS